MFGPPGPPSLYPTGPPSFTCAPQYSGFSQINPPRPPSTPYPPQIPTHTPFQMTTSLFPFHSGMSPYTAPYIPPFCTPQMMPMSMPRYPPQPAAPSRPSLETFALHLCFFRHTWFTIGRKPLAKPPPAERRARATDDDESHCKKGKWLKEVWLGAREKRLARAEAEETPV